MSEVDISQILSQMRALAAQAKGVEAPPPNNSAPGEFAALLKNSIDQVNNTQQQAGQLAEAFEKGDPNVDLTEVMTSLQKASLSFSAMTEVRNRLVSAYQEIMNMPV